MLNIYRYNFKGNIITNLVVILALLITILIPNTTQAVSVGVNYTNSWRYSKYIEGGSCSDFDAETNFTMSLSKQFNLYSTNLGNLNQNEWRIIRPGENITGINYGLNGSYNYSSGDKRTPPMDGQIKYWNYTSEPGWCNVRFQVRNQMRGGISSQLGYTLSSSDNSIIDCSSGDSCVARDKDGTATITVSFPGAGSYYVERNYEWGEVRQIYSYTTPTSTNSCRGRSCATTYSCPPGYTLTRQGPPNQGRGYSDTCKSNTPTPTWFKKDSKYAYKGFDYTLNSISYNVRVEIPNKPPTARYDSTSNIDYNTATANWSYSDPENQPQTNAEVKVYTNSNYTNGQVFTGSATGASVRNLNITGLRPGTTYYPKVRVRDSKGAWSSWANGGAFTTKVNNPPNLSQLTCKGKSEEPKYTSANLEWNYTGTDEPGDELILKVRWKRQEDGVWRVLDLPYNTRKGVIDIKNLISGYRYNLEVSLNDNRNIYLGDRWKGCDPVTPPNYPVPNVDFTLNSGTNQAVKGGILRVKTGDKVNTSWNITNPNRFTETGVKDNSCRLLTTNTSGEENVDIFNAGTVRGLKGDGILGQNLPVSPIDQEYKIELKCDGKEAKDKRNVSEGITLIIESYPLVTSCSVDGKNTVQPAQTDVNIKATVENVGSYIWKIGKSDRDINPESGNTSSKSLERKLSYVATEFGRYSPWLEVTKLPITDPERKVRVNCGTVTNLGDSNIREVR